MRGTMLSRTLRSYFAQRPRFVAGSIVGLAALIGARGAPPDPGRRGRRRSRSSRFGGPVAGALGVSLASVGRTVSKSLDARAELLWNTALVEVISHKTLRVDELCRWRRRAPAGCRRPGRRGRRRCWRPVARRSAPV